MKAIHLKLVGAMALGLSACGCVPSAEAPAASPAPVAAPATTPAPTPTPASPPAPPVVDEPRFENFLDAPQTPGNWAYQVESGETFALFGTSASNPQAIIRCDLNTRKVGIGRFGTSTPGAAMRLRAETGDRVLQTSPRQSSAPLAAAELDANDPTLDAIAITKGRFALGVEGMPTLYLPAWAEVTRVIEDCR